MRSSGDGSWKVAVDTLLSDTGELAGQSRGAAWRIVQTVVTHDPSNPALPGIAARLRQLGIEMPPAKTGNLLEQPKRHQRT